VDHPVSHELEREPAHPLAETADERAGGDRRQCPGTYQRLQHSSIAVKCLTALRVREQDAVPAALKLHEEHVQAGNGRGEGRLHEQPRACAESEAGQLLRLDVGQAGHRDLASGADHQRQLLLGQASVQLVHQAGDRAGVVGVAPADVGRCHERMRAGGLRGARQLDGTLERVGTIVDAREDVAVKVDHGGIEPYAPAVNSASADVSKQDMIARAGTAAALEFQARRVMFRSIVVGTDGSETATQAVRQAVDLARSIGAKLELVSAYEPVSAQRLSEERRQAPEDLQWAISPREDVDATLESAAELAREAGVPFDVYPRQGDPADAVLDVAEEREADLIIVGNKGMTGAKRFLLGSVPNKVSHHAPCSVLIIRTT